jgi:hypothetical protein
MPVKNEAWVLGLSARAALMWCDALVVLNDTSSDATEQICQSLRDHYEDRFFYSSCGRNVWDDMGNRQLLLATARDWGATHVAIIDADEVLTSNLLPIMRRLIENCQSGRCLQVPLRNLYHSTQIYRYDGPWKQWLSVAFKDESMLTWEPRGTDGYQYHHREPFRLSRVGDRQYVEGGVMHLQFVRQRAVRAKQAHYKMDERLRWGYDSQLINRRYGWWVDCSHCSLSKIGEWWSAYQDLTDYLDLTDDGNDWHSQACRRLWREHGSSKFAGLDLYGVVP